MDEKDGVLNRADSVNRRPEITLHETLEELQLRENMIHHISYGSEGVL